MNIFTPKKVQELSGISTFDLKQLKSVSEKIKFDGEYMFEDVFNKDYINFILPFLHFRVSSIERGYKKNPNIKFDLLVEIAERTSDLNTFAKLVLEHVEENSLYPVHIQENLQAELVKNLEYIEKYEGKIDILLKKNIEINRYLEDLSDYNV